jgi:DNA polymerase-3 subunit epsilon
MDSFIAIDYETANSSYESVCAVGATVVEEGRITSNIYSLIKPPKEHFFFDSFNVSIHGITEKDVKNAPGFEKIWAEIEELQTSRNLPIACHYAGFDIRVTEALLHYFEKDFQDIRFYDTCTVSRKVWPELINFKLNTISGHLGISLEHHNAASDAQACAMIALKHMELLSLSTLSDIAKSFGYDLGILSSRGVKTMSEFKRYENSRHYSGEKGSNSSKDVLPDREVNLGSDLFGKSVVFTGALMSMGRKEAIQRAVNNGATVISAVSKKTDFLVVGISDFLDFEKGIKTNKLKDAELVKQKGYGISIIDEEDFLRMTI